MIIIKKMMKVRFLFLLVLPALFFSCQVPKDIIYFQDINEYKNQAHELNLKNYELTLKRNDQLLITVTAPMIDQETVAQFNPPQSSYLVPGDVSVMKTQATQVHTIDSRGEINFPVLGKVKIGGLTKAEAISLLQEKVSVYLTDPTVFMQVLSFKITVLGEVRNPGVKAISDDRISILDAIGAAQDLTIYGDRKNILLIRDNNGEKEYANFDITRSDIFSSPYYYLQQNDVVIVNPNLTRTRESTYGASKSYQLSTYGTIISSLSALSTVALVIYNISKN